MASSFSKGLKQLSLLQLELAAMSAPVPRQTQEPVIHSQSHLPEKITHLAPEKRQYSEAGSALYGDVNSLLNPEPPVAQQHTGGPPLPKRRATVASARTGQACDRCKVRPPPSPAHPASNLTNSLYRTAR